MSDPLAFDDEHLTQLGLTLDFGPRDLAANRDGELSDAQIAQLTQDLRWNYIPIMIALLLAVLVVGASGATAGTFPVVPVVVLMALAAIPAFLLRQEIVRLPDRQVRRTQLRIGGLSLMARRFGLVDDAGAGGRITFPVEGGKKVFGPRHLYKVLRANRGYVVYYVPVRTWHGYRILSVEPVDESGVVFDVPSAKRKRKRDA